jgi:hypothetical protein
MARRRLIGIGSLLAGVGISAWITVAYRVWQPYGLAALIGPMVLVVYVPALAGLVACLVLWGGGERPPRG